MSRALGRYEILRPLARGGMAEVFLARRRVAGAEKRLVIKRIRPERATDPRFLELFVREARLSMALAHQNIVPVFDFGRVGDDLFLAMEQVEGHDVGATLLRPGAAPVEPALAAFIAAECAAALDYAHRRRGPDGEALEVVHRDVSPRNILVSWAGEVKLVDFGVAALAGDTDASVRGTPAYMAPEQARGEVVDGRSDVYALGLVLWELLTGGRARTGKDPSSLLAEARSGVLPPLPAEVPPGLAAVLRRATAAAVSDRYGDARAMHDDLDEFVAVERGRRPEAGAPRRRLAEWIAEAWRGVDEPGAAEPSGDGALGPMVTFVDDGADVVLGRTHRSIAETVGTVDQPEDSGTDTRNERPGRTPRADGTPTPVPAPAAAPSEGAAAGAAASPSATASASPRPADAATTPAPAERAPRRAPILAIAAGAAAIAGAALLWPRGGDRDPPATASGGTGTGTGTGAPAINPGGSPDAATAPTLAAAVDAAGATVALTAPDAGAPDAAAPTTTATGSGAAGDASHHPGTHKVHPGADATPTGAGGNPGSAASAGSGSGSGSAAAPTLHAVGINSKPWANFTIDDDPTPHQTPETVRLSPGRHVIHFDNPTLHVTRNAYLDVDHDTTFLEDLEH